MSASGFSPLPAASAASASSATSSSHQPPKKSLCAMDEPEEGSHDSPKIITDSTDDDLLPEQVARTVDTEVEEKDDPELEHDADAFVPNPNRDDTLAGFRVPDGARECVVNSGALLSGNEASTFSLSVKAEVFDIGSEVDEAKIEPNEEKLRDPEKERKEEPSTAAASETEGPQPTPSLEMTPLRSFAVNSARLASEPPPSRSEDVLGSTTVFKQTKTHENQICFPNRGTM